MDASAPPIGPSRLPAGKDAILRQRAEQLEAVFLAEMLQHSGLEPQSDASFGGGIGEEQFASFLRQEQARLMVDRGGIGLAESLFRAMGGGSDGNG